ncbi:MAG: M20 family metallopeptidase [Candidatus Lokiarchaeota archaeon]|nr:M20 family metallopeptidase [Candidatus Lokiarchaeota archaeon]
MSEELILNEIENNTEEYIEFLRELVQAESYNPPGNEKNVALKIEKYLKNTDIKSEIFPFGENRANLIATLNNNFEGENLLYNGHMDVVPPGNEEEWKYPPLSATIKGSKTNKKIFGRGAVDMKAGLAAMVIAVKILKKLGIKLSGNLILNAVADEETGGELGTRWCLENQLKSIKCNFAVIGEMSGMEPIGKGIAIGEKGNLHLKVITNGILGHSMMPSFSKNSINMMSEIILNLDKMDKYMPKINPPISYDRYKEIFGTLFPSKEQFERILNEQKALQVIFDAMTQFTKSFTIINAGVKENVIPDQCEAIINFRLLPGQTVEMVLYAIKKMITEELGYEIKNEPIGNPKEVFVYFEVYQYGEGSYWQNWEESQDLKDFVDIIEKIYGKKPAYILAPGGTDAKFFRNIDYCPQTIIFGPGEALAAHTTNESIKIHDFINAIKVYTLFAYNFLK